MRRTLLILAAMLCGGMAVFWAGHHVASCWCLSHAAQSADDLEWLRLEFQLSDTDLANVRQLHEGYLPRCRDFCERIATRKRELQGLLEGGTNPPSVIERKLVEIGTLRARCQSAMLQHFRDVAGVMPPEQGRRYLEEMERLTLGFHEQIEQTMSPVAQDPHAHH